MVLHSNDTAVARLLRRHTECLHSNTCTCYCLLLGVGAAQLRIDSRCVYCACSIQTQVLWLSCAQCRQRHRTTGNNGAIARHFIVLGALPSPEPLWRPYKRSEAAEVICGENRCVGRNGIMHHAADNARPPWIPPRMSPAHFIEQILGLKFSLRDALRSNGSSGSRRLADDLG